MVVPGIDGKRRWNSTGEGGRYIVNTVGVGGRRRMKYVIGRIKSSRITRAGMRIAEQRISSVSVEV